MWSLLLIGLRKTWPYFLGAALILGLAWWAHHRIYESGYAAATVKWQARWDAADRALTAANERARRTEEDSRARTEESERRIDETLQTLRVRSADYDARLRALSVRLAAASASSGEVRSVPGSPSEAAGTAESDQRAAEAGSRIAGIGADCEYDAARLAEWQRWYTEQRAIFTSRIAAPGEQ